MGIDSLQLITMNEWTLQEILTLLFDETDLCTVGLFSLLAACLYAILQARVHKLICRCVDTDIAARLYLLRLSIHSYVWWTLVVITPSIS